MRFLAGQFVFDSLCFISSCSPASAAVSWNAPYYCVQFLHVKNVLLDFRLTNAMFVFNLTCASVKQCVEIFQKMLVHNPPLWFLTVRWCAITHASFHYFDTGKKKGAPKVDIVSSASVFLNLYSSKATLFAFSGQCPAVKAPYQLLQCSSHFHFHPDRLNFCMKWLQCACMQPDIGYNLLISNELTSFKLYKQTHIPTDWLKYKHLQKDQQLSGNLHVNIQYSDCLSAVWYFMYQLILLSFQQTSKHWLKTNDCGFCAVYCTTFQLCFFWLNDLVKKPLWRCLTHSSTRINFSFLVTKVSFMANCQN